MIIRFSAFDKMEQRPQRRVRDLVLKIVHCMMHEPVLEAPVTFREFPDQLFIPKELDFKRATRLRLTRELSLKPIRNAKHHQMYQIEMLLAVPLNRGATILAFKHVPEIFQEERFLGFVLAALHLKFLGNDQLLTHSILQFKSIASLLNMPFNHKNHILSIYITNLVAVF